MKVEQFNPRKDFLLPGFFAPQEVEDLVKSKKVRHFCVYKLSYFFYIFIYCCILLLVLLLRVDLLIKKGNL